MNSTTRLGGHADKVFVKMSNRLFAQVNSNWFCVSPLRTLLNSYSHILSVWISSTRPQLHYWSQSCLANYTLKSKPKQWNQSVISSSLLPVLVCTSYSPNLDQWNIFADYSQSAHMLIWYKLKIKLQINIVSLRTNCKKWYFLNFSL